jgi:hypothetical protein
LETGQRSLWQLTTFSGVQLKGEFFCKHLEWLLDILKREFNTFKSPDHMSHLALFKHITSRQKLIDDNMF